MARRRRSGRARRLLIVALALVVIAIALWQYLQRQGATWLRPVVSTAPGVADGTPRVVSAARVDPANEGRRIRIEGRVEAAGPARDTELGVEAAAPVLLRKVEMRQWQETCSAGRCDYVLAWSAQPIDSSRFRVPQGHANTLPWPLRSARFVAEPLRLGAFALDPALLPRSGPTRSWPVTLAQLPPNLAASFRSEGGALYTGDPAHAAVGDLRVSYAVPAEAALTVVGTQRASRLVAQP